MKRVSLLSQVNKGLVERLSALCAFSALIMFVSVAHAADDATKKTEARAIFAGGCFWCMEAPFDKLEGVTATFSGYTGGHTQAPNYRSVSSGRSGHYEAVEVRYDPTKVGYAKLLEVFWHNIDPLDAKGQFCDKGSQYLSAIFYTDTAQLEAAQKSLAALQKSGELNGEIATKVLPAEVFYPAEEYHQDYYKKNPLRYKFYRSGCGRDARLHALWGEKAGH